MFCSTLVFLKYLPKNKIFCGQIRLRNCIPQISPRDLQCDILLTLRSSKIDSSVSLFKFPHKLSTDQHLSIFTIKHLLVSELPEAFCCCLQATKTNLTHLSRYRSILESKEWLKAKTQERKNKEFWKPLCQTLSVNKAELHPLPSLCQSQISDSQEMEPDQPQEGQVSPLHQSAMVKVGW